MYPIWGPMGGTPGFTTTRMKRQKFEKEDDSSTLIQISTDVGDTNRSRNERRLLSHAFGKDVSVLFTIATCLT